MYPKNILSFGFAAALVFGAATAMSHSAKADPVTVPNTGSEQSVYVPHAEPGNDPGVHTPQGERNEAQAPHLTSTPPLGRDTGSQAFPRFAAPTSEAAPHRDVRSDPALVPRTGSSQGVNPPGSEPR